MGKIILALEIKNSNFNKFLFDAFFCENLYHQDEYFIHVP
jgi:hypothetical protein